MDHLSETDLAGYLDRQLAEVEASAAESHLDECAACRAELSAVARLRDTFAEDRQAAMPSESRRHRRLLGPAVGFVMAASMATLLVLRPEARSDATRDGDLPVPEGVSTIDVSLPAEDGVIGASGVRFVWHRVAADGYRITVTEEDGALVWSASVVDTFAVVPSHVTLRAGARYFWSIEAIVAGISATSGMRSFTIAR